PVCPGKFINLDDHWVMLLEISWTIEFSPSLVPAKAPASPPPGFSFRKAALCRRQAPPWSSALMLGSCVRDREARADGQGRELIDRVAREVRRDRFEIGDFPGRIAAGHSVPPRWVRRACGVSSIWGENGPARM